MRLWIAKQRYLIDFTLASLARRKTKNLGLLLVYTLLVFVLASVTLLTSALRQEAARVLAQSPEVLLQRMVAGRHDLIPPGYIERIGRIRGVQQIEGRLWGYYYDAVVKANYTFMVARRESASAPAASSSAPGWRVFAGSRQATCCPSAPIRASCSPSRSTPSCRPNPNWSAPTSCCSTRPISAPSSITRPAITPTSRCPSPIRRKCARWPTKLAAALPDSRPILREEVLRTYQSIFDWREGIVLALLSAAILAFAILAWDKASGLSAEEKREIGILKAIGWETGDVIRMKLWEGMLVSLTAFLIGYLAAYVHVFHSSARRCSSRCSRAGRCSIRSFTLMPAIDGLQVATLFFFTVFPYAVGRPGADLAGGDHRSRCRDARLR